MLSFFRINDPYRLIGVLFFLLLLRLPYFIYGQELTVIELNWLLIGEKLGNGAIMYRDVWDHTAPMAAGFYWIIDLVFGRSVLAHHIISIILVWVQCFLFNNLLLNNKAYNENTYIPALVYAVLMNLFFDFYTLSPILMSQTFILMAINNIFKRIDNKTKDQFFLNTGIFLGLAALFYLPSVVIFFSMLLSLLLFTGSIARRYLLMIYGFVLPISLCWLYYFWHGAHREFISQFVSSVLFIKPTIYYSFTSLLLVSAVPVLFMLLAGYQLVRYSRYVNFQVRFQYVMFFMLVLSLTTFYFSKVFAPFQLIIFVPATAFFINHYFLLLRRRFLADIFFLVFIALIAGINYSASYDLGGFRRILQYERFIVQETVYDQLVEGKSVLYLGPDKSVFKSASHSSPFLDWDLSQQILREPGYYDNITYIYKHLSEELPEVIIDPNNLLPPLFDRMPGIASQYQPGPLASTFVLKEVVD